MHRPSAMRRGERGHAATVALERIAFGAIGVIVTIGGIALALLGCGPRLPHPPTMKPPPSAFLEVPFPPPPARVEQLPERPRGDAVWVDGSWSWEGNRWRWHAGGWFVVPEGTYYSPWVAERPDWRLMFANATWRNRAGEAVAPPQLLASPSRSGREREPGDGGVEAGAQAQASTQPQPQSAPPAPQAQPAAQAAGQANPQESDGGAP